MMILEAGGNYKAFYRYDQDGEPYAKHPSYRLICYVTSDGKVNTADL